MNMKSYIIIFGSLGLYRGYNLAKYNNKSPIIKFQTITLSVFFYLHPATLPFVLLKEIKRQTNKNQNELDYYKLF